MLWWLRCYRRHCMILSCILLHLVSSFHNLQWSCQFVNLFSKFCQKLVVNCVQKPQFVKTLRKRSLEKHCPDLGRGFQRRCYYNWELLDLNCTMSHDICELKWSVDRWFILCQGRVWTATLWKWHVRHPQPLGLATNSISSPEKSDDV